MKVNSKDTKVVMVAQAHADKFVGRVTYFA